MDFKSYITQNMFIFVSAANFFVFGFTTKGKQRGKHQLSLIILESRKARLQLSLLTLHINARVFSLEFLQNDRRSAFCSRRLLEILQFYASRPL